jgi:hypothetical protein
MPGRRDSLEREKQAKTSLSNEFDVKVSQAGIRPQMFDRFDHLHQLPVSIGAVSRDASDGYRRHFPHIVMINFGNGHVKVVPDVGDDRLERVSLVF